MPVSGEGGRSPGKSVPRQRPGWRNATAASRLALGAVLLATLLLQGAFLFETKAFPDFVQPLPGLDINLHWQAARQLRAAGLHEPNVEAAMLSSPLPMLWLAATQELLGESLWRHRVLYCLLGAMAVGLLFFLGRTLTGSVLGGATAAGLLALQPTFVYSSSLPLKTTVDIVLLAAGLLLTLRAHDAATAAATVARASLAAVLFLGAALNQWATVGPWLVVAGFLAVTSRPRPGGRVALLVPLLGTLVLLPLVRAGLGDLSASSGVRWCWPQLGIHMLIGAQPGATGVYQPVPGIEPSPRGHTLEARLAAEERLGRPISPAEADAFYRAQSRAAVAADPRRALRLLWRKLHLFFNAFEPKENFFVDELRQRSAVLRYMPESWAWLVALAAAGAAALACRRNWSHLALLLGLLAATVTATALTFVTARYRFPAVIPMVLLASHAVVTLADMAGQIRSADHRRKRRLAVTTGAMLVAGALAGWSAFAQVISPDDRAATVRRAQINARASERAIRLEERLAALRAEGIQSDAARREEIRLVRALSRDSEAFALARERLQEQPDEVESATIVVEYLILLGSYDEAARLTSRLNREGIATPAELARALPIEARRAFTRHVSPAAAAASRT